MVNFRESNYRVTKPSSKSYPLLHKQNENYNRSSGTCFVEAEADDFTPSGILDENELQTMSWLLELDSGETINCTNGDSPREYQSVESYPITHQEDQLAVESFDPSDYNEEIIDDTTLSTLLDQCDEVLVSDPGVDTCTSPHLISPGSTVSEIMQTVMTGNHGNLHDESGECQHRGFSEMDIQSKRQPLQDIGQPSQNCVQQIGDTYTIRSPNKTVAEREHGNIGLNPVVAQQGYRPFKYPKMHYEVEENIETPQTPALKAFIRSPFPDKAPDHSPIQGLTSQDTLLRTHFRVGEALNDSHKSQPAILIELYAFVRHSYRNRDVQFFTFADIFYPNWPPSISGEWQGWLDNPVLDQQGRHFLGPNAREWKCNSSTGSKKDGTRYNGHEQNYELRMCRVVGVMVSADGTSPMRQRKSVEPASPSKQVKMRVLSIRASDWSEIEYMKGVVEA